MGVVDGVEDLLRCAVDLAPALIALTEWGDRWAAPDGPPIFYSHTVPYGHRPRGGVREVRPGGRPV